MNRIKKEHLQCPIDLVLHIIGNKWTIQIIRDLCVATRRPSELIKSLKGINPKTLTDRLRDLEKWDIVKRQAYREIPPKVEYSLTTKGEQLVMLMTALKNVGENWQKKMDIEMHSEGQCHPCTVITKEKE